MRHHEEPRGVTSLDGQLTRASTTAVAAAGVLVLLAEVSPLTEHEADPAVMAAAAAAAVVASVARYVQHRAASGPRVYARLVNALPLTIAVLAASLTAVRPQPSIVSAGTLLAVLIAGLSGRRSTGLVVLAVHVGAELAGLAIRPDPVPEWTAVSVVVGAAVYSTTHTVVVAARTAMVRQAAAMRQLERAAAVRETFVATVSHELRTPVHVIAGMADTLAERWEGMSDSQRRQLLDRLRHHTDDLRTLVDTLLDFSRLRGDSLRFDPAPFDLAALCHRVVRQQQADHPGHRMDVDAPERAMAVGDRVLIGRVVDNLVSNAGHHTPPGTTVRLSVRAGTGAFVVTVADDGPGLGNSPVEPATSTREFLGDPLGGGVPGLGLGLALVGEILRLHDQRLDVTSGHALGAVFSFELPAAQ